MSGTEIPNHHTQSPSAPINSSFIVFEFYNNPVQVEDDNDKLVGLACFLKIVCHNEEYLKSEINSLVNMSHENDQFFEINGLFVLTCCLIEHVNTVMLKSWLM